MIDFLNPEISLMTQGNPKATSHEVGFHCCALLIPRHYFERFGLFDPALRYTQDVDMWFRMAGNVPFIHVKENLNPLGLDFEHGVSSRIVWRGWKGGTFRGEI